MSRKLRILAASLLIVVVSTVFLVGAAFAANQGPWGPPDHAGDCTCDCDGECDYGPYEYGKE